MVKFQFSFLQAGTVKHKSYSAMKLTKNNSFRLYLIKKNNWLEKVDGRYLSQSDW